MNYNFIIILYHYYSIIIFYLITMQYKYCLTPNNIYIFLEGVIILYLYFIKMNIQTIKNNINKNIFL